MILCSSGLALVVVTVIVGAWRPSAHGANPDDDRDDDGNSEEDARAGYSANVCRPILNHIADSQHSFAFLTCFMQHSGGPGHNGIVTWVTDNLVMGRRVDAMIQLGDLDGAGWCHTL
jgi:hypothetical protein